MKLLFAAVLLLAASLARGQPLLDFRNDLAFSAQEVDALAAQEYAARLRALAGARQLDRDVALRERLQRILPRLQRAAVYERPAAAKLAWEIHTCSGCDENAAALPGGRLLMSADFIAGLSLGDDELAYLLAHEMAHVLAEHARELATTARLFVSNGLHRDYADIQQELAESLPVNLRMQPEHVQQELEADYIGFVLGARAGFDPNAMLSLLDKLRTGSTSLLGTHPDDALRAQQARVMLEAARRLAAVSGTGD